MGFPAFGNIGPVSNITPFTYPEGASYLEILYGLKEYVEKTLNPWYSKELVRVISETTEIVEKMGDRVRESEETYDVRIKSAIQYVDAAVQAINNKTGPAHIQYVELGATPLTVTIDTLWPDKHPVLISVVQDANGDRELLLGEGITGPVDLDPTPNARTEFWLVPDGSGAWSVWQNYSSFSGTPQDISTAQLMMREGSEVWEALAERLAPIHAEVRAELDTVSRELAETISTAKAEMNKSISDSAKSVSDTVQSVNESLARFNKIYPVDPIDVVYIGDSYFMGHQDNAEWIKDVPTRTTELLNSMGQNVYRHHNYATGATGYIMGNGSTLENSFDKQLTKAIENPAITNCRMVIIGGGRNDAPRDVYATAKTLYQRAKAKWPQARIIVFPMWSREQFKEPQRVTFASIIRAAKDTGCVYDTNSLWVNALTPATEWTGTTGVLHPKDNATQNFAHALFSLIQGGSLPDQSAGIDVHPSSGISVGVVTLSGMSVTVALQQTVGADFGPDYLLGKVNYPVLTPGGINQYFPGFSGNGSAEHLFTYEQNSGNIFVTGSGLVGKAGLCGFSGSFPLGM